MKHTSQTEFGRPVVVCPVSSDHETKPTLDKWQVLEQLTIAAPALGLTHRTLGVLRALLTFLPQRILPQEPREAVVFPSNRTLAKRLNGMPESTLRRHLAQLVKSGIVSRHDSANRKRFSRRIAAVGQVAFGFDLSPLAREAKHVAEMAKQITQAAQTAAALRVEIQHLRQRLVDADGPSEATDDILRVLRRKPNIEVLEGMREDLTSHLKRADTSEMSATDSQNERHIQKEFISNSESIMAETNGPSKQKEGALKQLLKECSEYKSYFPEPVRHWEDVVNIANRLVPMIGIDRPVFEEAIRVIGLKQAAAAILLILEKLGRISNPGGYLRRITQRAGAGHFDLRKIGTV